MPVKKRPAYKYFYRRLIILLALVSVPFLTTAPSVFAHKVYLFAWVEGDTVYTESYFRGKKKVRGGLIKVLDPSGKELLEGKTNENGEFSFKIPQKTDLRIILDATMGHRAEFNLKTDEIPEIAVRTDLATQNKESQVPFHPDVQVDMEQIRIVMEKAIDERMKPVLRKLARLQEEKGPGLTDIIGGIGYIFGLMGLILYFKSRKKGADL